jgi:hypothetical protein
MLPKRFFPGVLILTALLLSTGCTTPGESKPTSEFSYRIISDECIRWGNRRGSYDYIRCIERKLEAAEKD